MNLLLGADGNGELDELNSKRRWWRVGPEFHSSRIEQVAAIAAVVLILVGLIFGG